MSAGAAIGPVLRESAPLRRRIAATLRGLVETGALAEGERLVETDLCAGLAVSRTVLREALRALESEGLLVAGPRGLSVARIGRREAENLYAVRRVLEGLLAREFCGRAGAGEIAALEASLVALRAAYRAAAPGDLLGPKRGFYAAIAAGAGNPVAFELLERLNARIGRLRLRSLARDSRKAASLAEIEALAAALAAGDAAGAVRLAERHVAMAEAAALSPTETTT